jgi:hypothetical protein
MFTSMLAQIHIGTFASEVGPIIKLGAAVGYLLPKVLRSHKMMFLREGIERRNFALCGMAAGKIQTSKIRLKIKVVILV